MVFEKLETRRTQCKRVRSLPSTLKPDQSVLIVAHKRYDVRLPACSVQVAEFQSGRLCTCSLCDFLSVRGSLLIVTDCIELMPLEARSCLKTSGKVISESFCLARVSIAGYTADTQKKLSFNTLAYLGGEHLAMHPPL